jgi:EpsI family protein
MIARTLVIIGLVIGTAAYSRHVTAGEAAVSRTALAELPLEIGGWQGRAAQPFPDDIVSQLGVDDYINRLYAGTQGGPISLYVGYYDQQRQGDTIHSPQNCLPGAGWQAVDSATHELPGGAKVNRYVIQKGVDTQVVLYWYQGRGRIVANEYANKALLMLDAARVRRTSGGLVRVITPVTTTPEAALADLSRFSAALLPHLARHLP